MLAVQRSVGVTPEVNLRILLHAGDDPGFETRESHHQKFKIGVSVTPQKGLLSSKISCKQECNPIGCVPSAAVAVTGGGGVSDRGVCLAGAC